MTTPSAARSAYANEPEIDDLIRRARAGELPAFNSLVLRYQDAAYGLAVRMLRHPEAAEDVTQEAFIAAWRRLDTYRGGSFRSWLFTIVANRARDELRRGVRRPTSSLDEARDDPDRADIDPPDRDPAPDVAAEQGELRAALEAVLRELPDDWREVVVLSDIEGLDYAEIAAVTGVALGTVKSRLSRARMRLREVIEASPELAEHAERLRSRR